MVGNHADQFSSPDNLEQRVCFICTKVSKSIKFEAFAGFAALDCRKLISDSSPNFIRIPSQSCEAVVSRSARISYYCHVLYAFMMEKGEAAVTLKMLSRCAQEENEPCLPPEISILQSSLVTLCDKGLVLFLDDEEDIARSWIVVKK